MVYLNLRNILQMSIHCLHHAVMEPDVIFENLTFDPDGSGIDDDYSFRLLGPSSPHGASAGHPAAAKCVRRQFTELGWRVEAGRA